MLVALLVALVLAALCLPRVVFLGELLAGESYLDKTLAPWEALRRQAGSGYLTALLGGHDLGAAPDIARWSPAHALWWVASPVIGSARAFSLLTPLLLGVGGWCAWGHLRALGLGQRAAVLGALVVCANELVFETIGTIGVLGTIAALPAVAWAGERLARAPEPRALGLGALAVGAALLGGHQQYAAFGLAFVILLTIVRLVQLQGPRAAAWGVAMAGLGSALSAVAILPAVCLLDETGRAGVEVAELLAEDGIFLDGPMLWGLLSLDEGLRRGDAVELDPVFVGAVPVVLGLIGLGSRRRGPAAVAGLAALGVLLLSHPATGGLEWLLGLGLPGLSLFKTAEGRLLVLFLAIGLAAPLGLEALESRLGRRRWGPWVGAALLGLTALGLVRMRAAVETEVVGQNRVTEDALVALRSPAAWHAGEGRRAYVHRDRAEEELENTALLWGGEELSGRAVLPPWRWLVFVHGKTAVPALEQRPPDRPEQGFLVHPGLVGVAALDTVVLPRRMERMPAGTGWERRVWADRVQFQRPPRPRVLLASEARGLADTAAVLEELRARSSEQGPLLVESGDQTLPAGGGQGSLAVVDDAGPTVVVDADLSGAAWLVLRRPPGAGWSVTVDGVAAPLWAADVLSQAVHLGAGRHRVVFVHRSPGLRLGAGVSLVALLVCLVLGAGGLRSRSWRVSDR